MRDQRFRVTHQGRQEPSCECGGQEQGRRCPTSSKVLCILHLRLSPNWPERQEWDDPHSTGKKKKKTNKAKQKLFLVVIKWGWQWCRDVIGKASCCHCWLGVFAQFFKRELLPRTKIVSPELGISPWMNPSPRKAPGPLLPCLRQPAFTSQSLSQGVGHSLQLLSETDSPHKSHLDQELRCEAQNS